jgi:hypothetical protein
MIGEFISDVAVDAIDKLAEQIHNAEARRFSFTMIEFKNLVCMNVTKIFDIIEGVQLDYAGNYHTVAQHGLRTLYAISTRLNTPDSANVCAIVYNTVLGRMRMYSHDSNKLMVQEFGIMLLQNLSHTPTVESHMFKYMQTELYRVIIDAFRFKELSLQARSVGMKTIERIDADLCVTRADNSSPDVVTANEHMYGLTYYREHRRLSMYGGEHM